MGVWKIGWSGSGGDDQRNLISSADSFESDVNSQVSGLRNQMAWKEETPNPREVLGGTVVVRLARKPTWSESLIIRSIERALNHLNFDWNVR